MISLDETEAKLLTLALNPAAAEGEINNAAVALIRSWRRRGVTVENAKNEQQKNPIWGFSGGTVTFWRSW